MNTQSDAPRYGGLNLRVSLALAVLAVVLVAPSSAQAAPQDSLMGSLRYMPESVAETVLGIGDAALGVTADSIHTLALMVENLNGALAHLASVSAALGASPQAAPEGQNGDITLHVFPQRVVAGDSLNLAWSSRAMSGCVVTTGDYTVLGADGSKWLRAMLPGDHVFELRCMGVDGAERTARVPVKVLSEEAAATYVGNEVLMTIAYIPESLYHTVADATDFMAAVAMAPAKVLADGLSNTLYEAGLY